MTCYLTESQKEHALRERAARESGEVDRYEVLSRLTVGREPTQPPVDLTGYDSLKLDEEPVGEGEPGVFDPHCQWDHT